MADEELTHGEIKRTLERIERQQAEGQRAVDDRLAKLAADMVPTALWSSEHRALEEKLGEFKAETLASFTRVEKTSLERRDALVAKDKELGRQIGELKTRIDGDEKGRTAKAANWIAIGLLLLTAIGLAVTVLTHGGK